MSSGRIVDVHHHILPPEYVERVGYVNVGAQGSSGRVPEWSKESALEKMDRANIASAITSVSSPGVSPISGADAVALARWCNEFAAGMVQEHPSRFGMFATLPCADMDAALREVSFAYEQLQTDGVCLLSNYEGLYLGEERFHPLYEELNRRNAVVFIHPTSPRELVRIDALSASMLEFPFDTTRTVASLIFGGVTTRFPNIRWIVSHAGGTIPYLAWRMELLTRNNPALRAVIPHGFVTALSKFYFDCALSINEASLSTLLKLLGPENVLFGTDYPFGPKNQMVDAVESFNALTLPETDKKKVELGNSLELFDRLKSYY